MKPPKSDLEELRARLDCAVKGKPVKPFNAQQRQFKFQTGPIALSRTENLFLDKDGEKIESSASLIPNGAVQSGMLTTERWLIPGILTRNESWLCYFWNDGKPFYYVQGFHSPDCEGIQSGLAWHVNLTEKVGALALIEHSSSVWVASRKGPIGKRTTTLLREVPASSTLSPLAEAALEDTLVKRLSLWRGQ